MSRGQGHQGCATAGAPLAYGRPFWSGSYVDLRRGLEFASRARPAMQVGLHETELWPARARAGLIRRACVVSRRVFGGTNHPEGAAARRRQGAEFAEFSRLRPMTDPRRRAAARARLSGFADCL